jgi:hypothetical protein
MTDRVQNSQEDWYIRAPKSKFPEPKFHFGQQVALSWEDDLGECCCEIGEIIGMQYTTLYNQPAEWFYQMRLLNCNYNPCFVGTEDEYFQPESQLVADDSAIARANPRDAIAP